MPPISSLLNAEGEYADSARFVREHGSLTYGELDRMTLAELRLFDLPKEESFLEVEQVLDRIIEALPSIRRIIARPIVHLKDTRTLSPIEAVRVIDSHTLSHAAVHSELWCESEEDGIRPRRLMTLEKTETYATYENVVFTRTFLQIKRLIKRTAMLIKDILYGCRDMQFDMLDTTHHSSYFLALGKLHSSYSRAQERHTKLYQRCAQKLIFIEKSLAGKSSSPVIAQCSGSKGRIALKRTNVFRSHRDYKRIYSLTGYLNSGTEIYDPDEAPLLCEEGYADFCTLLSLFAIGHFNLAFDAGEHLELAELDATARFLGWSLRVRRVKDPTAECLILEFNKDRPYTSCLIIADPDAESASAIKELKERIAADEYLFACAAPSSAKQTVRLRIYDPDSFRHVQQILLRGMLCSDIDGGTCAFCGHTTRKTPSGYDCDFCRARVERRVCPTHDLPYVASSVIRYASTKDEENAERGKFLHDRYAEARLHFRNVTPIAADLTPICPHCHKPHR